MLFEILGPMRVNDSGGTRQVAGARQRILLGALLAHANQPLPAEQVAEFIWDGAPPAGAMGTLRTYVTRLRQSLGPQVAARILTRDPGYLVRVDADELDALAFDVLYQQAAFSVRAGEWGAAVEVAGRALALWRGTALVDVPSQLLRDAWLPHLDRQRAQIVEWQIEAELQLGHHDQIIPRLSGLIDQHPLRERFRAQLMLALARTGRQAEALMAYQQARQVLVAELGIEPGPELRDLHERILAGDPGLLAPATPPDPAGARQAPRASTVPRQLPAAVGHFVGRAGELDVLSEQLTRQSSPGGAVVISAIGGAAGIGKTALAVHWAHQHADRFPDGQLYVNLRGFDPGGTPVPAANAVRGFLTALGVPAQRIPTEPDEQTALYRSELADRRMLIVLDNARDVEQVRPLLPGSPGCLMLVTSRDRLGALVALDGAVPLALDLLTEPEAHDLLIDRLGAARVLADRRATGELIELCARLPLALNIAAAHAALHPARPLSDLADELRDIHRRLDTLTIGEATADIRAVFSWSYEVLAPESARMFRLLGVHPGPDISLAAAASLAVVELDDARGALGDLAAAHLIAEHAPGRYTFHDLLRAYAADLVHTHESAAEADRALQRVCDFHLHTARAADRLLSPHRPVIPFDPPAPGVHPHPLADDPAALAWFDVELPNLLAVQQTAISREWHSTVWQLAWTLSIFHYRRGRFHDELAMWRAALEAAYHLSDPTTLIRTPRLLGRTYTALGRHREAIEQLDHSLALAEQHGDRAEQAHSHRQLAPAWELAGDDQKALHHAARALDLYRTLDEPIWIANVLNLVGWYSARVGDCEVARTHCQDALALHREHHSPVGEADTLDSLGYIEHRTGNYRQAVDYYQQALAVFRTLDNEFESADTLRNLGHPYAALGQRQQASAAWQEAFKLYLQQGRTEDAASVRRELTDLEAGSEIVTDLG